MQKFLSEISPKITQKYIQDNARNLDAHYGSNPNGRLLFQFVDSLGRIGDREKFRRFIEKEVAEKSGISLSDRKFVADRFFSHQIYECAENPYNYRAWKASVDESGKRIPRQKHWSENRLSAILSGKLSFLCDEGDQLFLGMRYGLGDDWANSTNAGEFATCNIYDFVTERLRDGLLLPWDRMDPVMSFRMLAEQPDKFDVERELKIVPVSSTRPSIKRIGEVKKIDLVQSENSLKRDSKFQVHLKGFATEEDHLAIEYSQDPFTVNGSDEAYRGEIMPFNRHVEDRIIFEGEENKPFEIGQPSGEYGFIVISGYDIDSLKRETGLDAEEEFLNEDQMRSLAFNFRKLTHTDDADLSVKVTNYSVVD